MSPLSRRARRAGLQVEQIERLRRAEVALAEAATTEAAASELAEHALALLGATSAVVLIEAPGDTVRVCAGSGSAQGVYGAGSRMRLLEDDGVPCGSIGVSARGDGRPYTEADERILDALAQRVSSTLHRLRLFEEVQAERQTIADILGSSSDGIFSVGPDLRVRSWNPAMARITGVEEPAVVGEHCCTAFRPVDEAGELRTGAACPGRHGRVVEGLPLRVEGASGEPRWLSCTFSPMSDGGYVVVARDVTARKQVEDMKADFLATISHELRTPLTPIQGFLQTLLRRDGDFGEEDRRRIFEVMLRESKRLERLIKDLLDATSLDHTDALFLPEVLDWGAVAAEVVDTLRRSDPEREIELVRRRGVPKVVADEQRATQVLANLLGNALKYSPPGSPIRVTLSRTGDKVLTTVADRGPGIAVADRQRVFERFTRLGDHLTRAQGGVGLGLYIARRLVEAMGGEISVARAPGGGAAFSFTLPSAASAPAAPSDADAVSSR